MDLRWKQPFTFMVSGPTSCGKTTFVADMVMQASQLIDPPPDSVIWVHDDYQPVFDQLKGQVTLVDTQSW